MGRSDKRRSRYHRLPEGILEDILVKLPVKSIIRFKSVSKLYFDLIKSSRFINKHLIENEESLFAICFVFRNTNIWHEGSAHVDRLFLSLCSYDEHRVTSDTWAWPVLNFELPISNCRRSNLYLVDQFNGIMCLTNYDIILLINPSLAEVKLVPITSQEDFILVGFGFDNMTMDFKVVRVMALRSGDGVTRQWGEVYSLRSNCWRKLDDEIPFVVHDSTNCSTFFNGVVHWCVVTGMEGSLSWRILTFDLGTELFHQMEFPQGWGTNFLKNAPGLFVLNQESLAFVSYGNSSDFVNVWRMNKHGTDEENWTKLYSTGPLTDFSKPISFLNNHKLLYKTNISELILYDIVNHCSSAVCNPGLQIPRESFGDLHCFPLCLEMGVCRSSLVSLNT